MNWRQELAEEITAIQDLNKNTAVLTLRIDTLEEFYGGDGRVIDITREIPVTAPAPVDLRLIDGVNYTAGDFTLRVSFAHLQDALKDQAGDPAITVNRIETTLSAQRPFTPQKNWGIVPGGDVLSIGGNRWSIAGIKGLTWLDGEPAVFELKLRK